MIGSQKCPGEVWCTHFLRVFLNRFSHCNIYQKYQFDAPINETNPCQAAIKIETKDGPPVIQLMHITTTILQNFGTMINSPRDLGPNNFIPNFLICLLDKKFQVFSSLKASLKNRILLKSFPIRIIWVLDVKESLSLKKINSNKTCVER